MLRLNDKHVILNVCKSMKPDVLRVVSVIDVYDEEMDLFYDVDSVTIGDAASNIIPIKERLGVEALAVDEMVYALYGIGFYTYAPKKFDFDLKNRTTASLSIKDPLAL